MKRALASLVASAMLLFALAGCSNGNNPAENPAASPTSPPASSTQAAEPVTISVGVPTAPPALPVLHMMEAGLLGENVTIDLNVWNSPEELLAMVQGGEHDLYAFPLTVVSTLYNKGLDVRLMNVNTWGVTYFMTTDPAFETWADLAGADSGVALTYALLKTPAPPPASAAWTPPAIPRAKAPSPSPTRCPWPPPPRSPS